MSKSKKERENDRREAIELLRTGYGAIRPGQTVYTTCTHVARSGMSRRISVLVAVPGDPNAEHERDREPRIANLSFLVARATGNLYHERDNAVVMGGCGMDMGFKLVHDLGRVLFPDGGPLELSPREAQERRRGETIERDGGYLLRHSWI